MGAAVFMKFLSNNSLRDWEQLEELPQRYVLLNRTLRVGKEERCTVEPELGRVCDVV